MHKNTMKSVSQSVEDEQRQVLNDGMLKEYAVIIKSDISNNEKNG